MDGIIFKCRPVYTNYESSRCGIIRNKRLRKCLGRINNMGYLMISFQVDGKIKQYLSSRFIFKCHNGLIPPGLVIDHINRNRLDNIIENLRAVTSRENSLNCGPKTRSQRRPVIGVMDNEERFFPSTYSAGKHYDIHRRSIQHVADNITLAAYSKRFQQWVSFLYQ